MLLFVASKKIWPTIDERKVIWKVLSHHRARLELCVEFIEISFTFLKEKKMPIEIKIEIEMKIQLSRIELNYLFRQRSGAK